MERQGASETTRRASSSRSMDKADIEEHIDEIPTRTSPINDSSNANKSMAGTSASLSARKPGSGDAASTISRINSTKRPKNTAFAQQRLHGWNPILTPHNVLPTLLFIGLLFVPLGILFLLSSNNVQEYSMDYTRCLLDATSSFTTVTSGPVPFEWRVIQSAEGAPTCQLRFDLKSDMEGPVYMYYRLTNYYQNNRMYVKSADWRQLSGEALALNDLSDCDPLKGPANSPGLVYYPCGLIANSMFNDTISSPINIDAQPPQVATFSPTGIAWPSDADRYGKTAYTIDQIRPPPYWVNNRNLVNPDGTYKFIPDLKSDERFQVWMRVAGLPTFRKLYGKRSETMPRGKYTILIDSVFEVMSFGGTKSVIISTCSWIGGKNPFLGIAYIATGSLFILVALAFLVRHIIAPRRMGDVQQLSWSIPDHQS